MKEKPLKAQVSLKVLCKGCDGGHHTRVHSPSLLGWYQSIHDNKLHHYLIKSSIWLLMRHTFLEVLGKSDSRAS